jgi:hypothetical protein
MTNLIREYWKLAGNDLGIKIESPFKLFLKDGTFIEFDVLVKDFGAKLGMLITTDYKKIKNFKTELVEKGYGYSVLSEYAEGRIYNPESFKPLLSDWGWSGDPASAPAWLKEVPDPFLGYDYSDED